MLNFGGVRKCPKCDKTMLKVLNGGVGDEASLFDQWKCPNQDCGYEERDFYVNHVCEKI